MLIYGKNLNLKLKYEHQQGRIVFLSQSSGYLILCSGSILNGIAQNTQSQLTYK